MIKLYSTGCPRCKVLKKKLETSGKEFEVIEDLVVLNEFADAHDIHSAPFVVMDDERILDFSQAIKELQ